MDGRFWRGMRYSMVASSCAWALIAAVVFLVCEVA